MDAAVSTEAHRDRSGAPGVAVLVLVLGMVAVRAVAQPAGTVQVVRVGVVMENPRGDSVVLGLVEPDTVLEVLEVQAPWYRVRALEETADWRLGWIHQRVVRVIDAPRVDPDDPAAMPAGPSLRGFGQIGAIRFAASDSFDAVTGSPWGVVWGGGGQLAFGSGLFLQGAYERFSTTGQRVFVFDDEVFEVGIESDVTVTPIQLTVGYRRLTTRRVVGYVGGGLGVTRLEERAPVAGPGEDIDESSVSYHVLGGVEYPLRDWLWIGGEGQWTSVPGVLGDDGVSEALDEDDLGGFTLRFKVAIGR